MHQLKVHKRYITIIEIMIVFVIILMISAVVAVNVRKMLREQHFRSEVGIVLDRVRLAQDLMIILGTDAHLKIAQNKTTKNIRIWIEVEEQLAPALYNQIHRENPPIEAIGVIEFVDELNHTKSLDSAVIDLKFLSGGTVMSKGILKLATLGSPKDSEYMERFICLSGHPQPITSSSESFACKLDEHTEYYADVSDITIKEVQAKEKRTVKREHEKQELKKN